MEALSIVISTSIVYLFIVIALQLIGRTEMAQLSMSDLVFVMLLSNAVQNAMVGSNTSLWGGLIAATTLFIINALYKEILYRHQGLSKFVGGEPVMLIYKGQVKDQNLRKARLTTNELLEAVREHGIENVSQVKLAVMEVDGNISVVPAEQTNPDETSN